MRDVGHKRGLRVFSLALMAAATVSVITAGVAAAMFPTDNVTSYAACLGVGSSPGGTFTNVAVGDVPSKPCTTGQVLVHLSGGDITSADTPASGGLKGGTANGAASLELQTSFKLPQACVGRMVPKWDASSGQWVCAADDNTTFSGADFTLSDQSCGSGAFADGVDTSGKLTCDQVHPDLTRVVSPKVTVCSSLDVTCGTTFCIDLPAGDINCFGAYSAVANCPSGSLAVGGGYLIEGSVYVKASGTNSNLEQWIVQADSASAFEGGKIQAVAVCMKA